MILRSFLNMRFILSCMMFSICALFAVDAYASGAKGDIFTRFKKPLPELELLSDEEFRKVTKPIKKKPYGQDVLEYTIRIPKDWVERDDKSSSNFTFSEKLFLELNVFYGKPTPSGRSRLEIEALNLDGGLTAEQWYLKYILDGGYSTEGFVTHSEKKVESLMVVMEQDTSYYVRTLVLLNGDKVIMVKYFVPVYYIRKQAPMQEQVLKSFKLSNDIEKTPIDMDLYRFLDIAELRYPSSWKVFSKPLRTVDRMNVSLLNLREVAGKVGEKASVSTEGKVDVAVVAASQQVTLIDEVSVYRQKVEAEGMLIGDRLEVRDDFTYNDSMDFAITEVYESLDSTNNLSAYELWFTVAVGGNYYYFFTLLTPSRNERFGVWAENTQSFKAMLEAFSPMSGAFLERD